MKKSILIALVWTLSLTSFAQSGSWDSTYRPITYTLKVGLFKSYPNDHKDIVFLGNSITAGADWIELLGIPNARNRGIPGDITFGVLERLDEVTERHPAKVFVLIGINDIARNIPDSVILSNYRKIILGIKNKSPRTKIYFQTLMPVNNTFAPPRDHFNKDQHIQAVNDGLKLIAKDENIVLIDLHPNFLDGDGRLKKEVTPDGLHPNADGYKIWKTILIPYLK